MPVKNAVYVLPNSAQALEDLEWLRAEVTGLGGHASIFEAASISGSDELQFVRQFQALRSEDYARLSKEIKALRAKIGAHPRPTDEHLRVLRTLRERLENTRRIDFFSAPGATEVETALQKLEADTRRTPSARFEHEGERINPLDYVRRTWVTRPRPGVDRFSSAWLIRRFIDARATFVFAGSPDRAPDAVPFDMYQNGGFKHEGDKCTFEVLQARFGISGQAVRRIGEIVHDLDLKDARFKSPHAATIGTLVEGLRVAIAEDDQLLEQGMALFEALYQSFRSTAPARSNKRGIC